MGIKVGLVDLKKVKFGQHRQEPNTHVTKGNANGREAGTEYRFSGEGIYL